VPEVSRPTRMRPVVGLRVVSEHGEPGRDRRWLEASFGNFGSKPPCDLHHAWIGLIPSHTSNT
jgi:hypothetical protein